MLNDLLSIQYHDSKHHGGSFLDSRHESTFQIIFFNEKILRDLILPSVMHNSVHMMEWEIVHARYWHILEKLILLYSKHAGEFVQHHSTCVMLTLLVFRLFIYLWISVMFLIMFARPHPIMTCNIGTRKKSLQHHTQNMSAGLLFIDFLWVVRPFACLFFGTNINTYLLFISFLHTDIIQVVKILPNVAQGPTFFT